MTGQREDRKAGEFWKNLRKLERSMWSHKRVIQAWLIVEDKVFKLSERNLRGGRRNQTTLVSNLGEPVLVRLYFGRNLRITRANVTLKKIPASGNWMPSSMLDKRRVAGSRSKRLQYDCHVTCWARYKYQTFRQNLRKSGGWLSRFTERHESRRARSSQLRGDDQSVKEGRGFFHSSLFPRG